MGHQPTPAVLVVEADVDERDRLGDILTRHGFDVLACPGPTAPDYTCVGERDGRCPIVDAVRAVVLDLRLSGDDMMLGTSACELVRLYVTAGRPVVALGSAGHLERDLLMEGVVRLPRQPDEPSTVATVRAMIRSTRGGIDDVGSV